MLVFDNAAEIVIASSKRKLLYYLCIESPTELTSASV